MICRKCGTQMEHRESRVGSLEVCPQCRTAVLPVRVGVRPLDASSVVETARTPQIGATPRQTVSPVLGIDPGVKMGFAVVSGRRVLWARSIDWHRDSWVDLSGVVTEAKDAGCHRAVIEILGPTRGEARGRANAWAVMSETAGRAVQECERQGLEVVRMTPGEWRGKLGLPASFGVGKTKDDTARGYARAMLGFDSLSAHVAEAALMALAGVVG